MYELICPSCDHVQRSPFVRAGAVVACPSCTRKFRIEARHIRRIVADFDPAGQDLTMPPAEPPPSAPPPAGEAEPPQAQTNETPPPPPDDPPKKPRRRVAITLTMIVLVILITLSIALCGMMDRPYSPPLPGIGSFHGDTNMAP